MITTTHRLIAANDILDSINADLRNNPRFTMTHAQLRTRITRYLDDPATTDTDIDAIYNLLNAAIYCFRD